MSNDTNNPMDFATTLGETVHAALIRAGSVMQLVAMANDQFKAGDDVKGKNTIANAMAVIGESTSIQEAVYESLPRTGEPPTGMG